MPELKPYRAALSQALETLDDTEVRHLRRFAWVADFAQPSQNKFRSCLMIGTILAWWLLNFLLIVALWGAGGEFLESFLGRGPGMFIVGSTPCLCFPIMVVGTFVIVLGWGKLWDVVISRRLGKPVMWVSADRLQRGDTLDITYQQDINSTVEIEGVELQLVLRETATYTSGTDTVTATHDHVSEHIERPGRHMEKGYRLEERASFDLPITAMHTFTAKNNKLQWFVTVKVRLARWPDFEDLYEVIVLPEGTA